MRLIGVLVAALLVLAACGTSEGGVGEPLRINVRSAPPAYLGERYDARFPASGGVRPYRYELEGKLPPGLNFVSGRLSGIPREKGSFKITVVVSDAALSSRSATYTLKVSDPPPPALKIKLPLSETDAPFIAVFTLSERPTSAVRLRLNIQGLKPNLDSFKAAPGLLYVLRYDEEKQTLDLDGAFVKTFKGGELFRLKLEPQRKLRPVVRPQTQFYSAKGEPYTKASPKRPADRGAYDFDDLRALAASWRTKPAAENAAAEKGNGAAPKPPASGQEGGDDAAAAGETPAPPTQSPPSAPETARPEPAGEPAETQNETGGNEGAEGDRPTAPAFDPDLNADGAVDAADLELLRQSYAFNPGGGAASNEAPEDKADEEKVPEGAPEGEGAEPGP